MGVKYILKQAGLKMGLDPADSNQRATLLRFLNEAAMEVYDQADGEGSLMEQLFKVDGDQQIALPPHVGPLRAMREYSTHVPWSMVDMRPRYNQFNWNDRWRKWRLKGVSAISYPLVNQAPLKLVVGDIETPPVVVSLLGPTLKASSIGEDVVMDALTKNTVNNFIDLTSVRKDRVNTVDVYVKDADDNVLSQIPNNMLAMRYRLVDVSLYPWSNTDQTTSNHYMEVLFKKALPWLENDDDEFPMPDHDNILVNKVLQLWSEEQGKGDAAVAYDSKATRSMARKKEDSNRGTEEVAALTENPHDTLLPRQRRRGPSRYNGQVYY